MKPKTKIILLVAVLVGLEAIYLGLQVQRIIEVEERYSVLAKKNAELHNTINRLQAKMQAEQERQQAARAAAQPADAEIFIPVAADTLKNSAFNIADLKFNLSKDAVNLLGLTDDEASKVQQTFLELRDKIQAYQRATVHTVSADEIPTKDLSIARAQPGSIAYYEIPPMSESGLAQTQNWFAEQLANAVGKVRADVLVTKAEEQGDFWLRSGTKEYLTFFSSGANVQWDAGLMFGGSGWGGSGGSSKDLASSEWGYLFGGADSSTQTIDNSPAP